ncbi:MAG: hypothetical protein RXP98_05925 [Thermoplasmata archaeon]
MLKINKNYLLAFASSMAYSYWLIGSSIVVLMGSGSYDYFSLFIIMLISLIFSILFFKKIKKIVFTGVLSGLAFSIGNILLYILIGKINIVIAGSFTALNLVFFPLFMYSKGKRNLIKHIAGSAVIAAGLILESLTIGNFRSDLLIISLLIGIFLGFVYAIATYLFNVSLIREKEIKNTIFTIFLTETIFYGIFTIAFMNFSLSLVMKKEFIINNVLVSLSIFIGIYLEARGFKGFKRYEFAKRNTVNILSNLELLPVIFLSIIEFKNYISFYITGLVLIIIGMIIISIKNNAGAGI